MKAMILAAGFGTRLGELTKTTPKCLIPVAGKPMLEHVLSRLEQAGVKEAVINLHYLPDQVKEFVKKRSSALKIHFSEERILLGTGGGLKHARKFFEGEDSFLMLNADIYCDFELEKLCNEHCSRRGIATLLTMERQDTSYLAFSSDGALQGWKTESKQVLLSHEALSLRAFCGIQCLSKEIFEYMKTEADEFSIIETYMEAAKAGEKIFSLNLPARYIWSDVGTVDSLRALEEQLGRVS